MLSRRGITVLRHGHGIMAFEEKSRLKNLYWSDGTDSNRTAARQFHPRNSRKSNILNRILGRELQFYQINFQVKRFRRCFFKSFRENEDRTILSYLRRVKITMVLSSSLSLLFRIWNGKGRPSFTTNIWMPEWQKDASDIISQRFVMVNPDDVFWLLVPPIVSRKI